MKRLLLLVLVACLTCVSFGLVFAQVPPVAPYLNPAPGVIARSWACYTACVLPVDVVVGDYGDRTGTNTAPDGWIDIAVLCSATGQVQYFANQGTGAFNRLNPVPVASPRFAGATDLELGDAGNLVLHKQAGVSLIGDTAFGNYSAHRNALLNTPAIPVSAGFITADLNHTPGLEVVLFGGGIPGIQIVGGPALATSDGATIVAAVAGDLNGDSWIDVAVVKVGGGIDVFFNPRGAWINAVAANVPTTGLVGWIPNATGIAIGDFNADGLNDLVVVGNDPANTPFGLAQAYINTLSAAIPTVGFVPVGAPMSTWGFNASAVEVLDADGNGRDDFAVANYDSATVTIFLTDALPGLLQDGRAAVVSYCLPEEARKRDLIDVGFWLFKYELQCGYFPIALDSADFDWNGKADLVVVLQSATENLRAQEESCIEIIFDVACGYHREGPNSAAQMPHQAIPNLSGESKDCEPCGPNDPCSGNTPPDSDIEVEGDSGNP